MGTRLISLDAIKFSISKALVRLFFQVISKGKRCTLLGILINLLRLFSCACANSVYLLPPGKNVWVEGQGQGTRVLQLVIRYCTHVLLGPYTYVYLHKKVMSDY